MQDEHTTPTSHQSETCYWMPPMPCLGLPRSAVYKGCLPALPALPPHSPIERCVNITCCSLIPKLHKPVINSLPWTLQLIQWSYDELNVHYVILHLYNLEPGTLWQLSTTIPCLPFLYYTCFCSQVLWPMTGVKNTLCGFSSWVWGTREDFSEKEKPWPKS